MGDVDWAAERAIAEAEFLDSTCTIVETGAGDVVFDAVNLTAAQPADVPVYEGRCSYGTAIDDGTLMVDGAQGVNGAVYVVRVPVGGGAYAADQLVLVDGLELVVRRVPHRTHMVLQRLVCTVRADVVTPS